MHLAAPGPEPQKAAKRFLFDTERGQKVAVTAAPFRLFRRYMNIMENLRSDEYPLRRKVLVVLLVALCLGAGFMALILFLGSCSSGLSASLGRDGGCKVEFRVTTPAPIAAKLRKLEQSGGTPASANSPLFSSEALRASIASKPGLRLIELAQPDSNSLQGAVSVRSLPELASSPELAGSGLLSYTTGTGWTELRVRIARGQSGALSALLPGMDPYLLEALSPPALEEDAEGISAAEYRTMLKSVLGEKAMPAMEEAAVSLAIVAPGPVLASGGGKLEGSALSVKIPVIDALVLEKPIEFWIRWKTP